MYSKNIFTPLHLKSETSAHAQFVINLLYMLLALTNILACYHWTTYIEVILVRKWGHKMKS